MRERAVSSASASGQSGRRRRPVAVRPSQSGRIVYEPAGARRATCNTGRGEKRSGEGIVGLTWALFVAGAPTQVLSQWSVDDASTATLMERFYGGVTHGQAKGSALRAAELTLLRDGRHSHPYYWAPFVLTGGLVPGTAHEETV